MNSHWTDDQLIAHLYGVGPEDGHAEQCGVCSQKLASMRATRSSVEEMSSDQRVSAELLLAQRRRFYARLEAPAHWWSAVPVRRWASSVAAVLVLAGGVVWYEQSPLGSVRVGSARFAQEQQITDAQLAADVSRMAESPEPSATAPLHALFDE